MRFALCAVVATALKVHDIEAKKPHLTMDQVGSLISAGRQKVEQDVHDLDSEGTFHDAMKNDLRDLDAIVDKPFPKIDFPEPKKVSSFIQEAPVAVPAGFEEADRKMRAFHEALEKHLKKNHVEEVPAGFIETHKQIEFLQDMDDELAHMQGEARSNIKKYSKEDKEAVSSLLEMGDQPEDAATQKIDAKLGFVKPQETYAQLVVEEKNMDEKMRQDIAALNPESPSLTSPDIQVVPSSFMQISSEGIPGSDSLASSLQADHALDILQRQQRQMADEAEEQLDKLSQAKENDPLGALVQLPTSSSPVDSLEAELSNQLNKVHKSVAAIKGRDIPSSFIETSENPAVSKLQKEMDALNAKVKGNFDTASKDIDNSFQKALAVDTPIEEDKKGSLIQTGPVPTYKSIEDSISTGDKKLEDELAQGAKIGEETDSYAAKADKLLKSAAFDPDHLRKEKTQ